MIWKIFYTLLLFYHKVFCAEIGDIVLTSQPVPVSFTSPDAMLRLQPWNFAKYSSIEMQIHTREPRGILFFVGSSSSDTDCIGLEIFHSILYGFGKMLGKDFRMQLSPDNVLVSNGEFFKVTMQILATNHLIMKFNDVEIGEKISTPGKLDFDRYTYIGGIDSISTLPWQTFSQTGFIGCINYIRVNGERFVDINQHAKQTEMEGSNTGVCKTTVARCLPGLCGPGKCYERSYNLQDHTKNFYCDCSGTFKSYSTSAIDILRGEPCIVDSQKFQCNSKSYLRYTLEREKSTHYDDISIDFQTSGIKEPIFLMKAGTDDKSHTLISVEVITGQIVIIVRLYDSASQKYKSTFFSKKNNLNDGQWHTLKFYRYAGEVDFYVDEIESKTKGKLYQTNKNERFSNRVKEIFLGSTTRPPNSDKCTGEIKNFYWNENDLLGKRNKFGTYNSQLIVEKPTLPVLPPFPRQPPIPCTLKPRHIYTVLNNIPMTSEGITLFIEFKTKYDGIIWHVTNVFSTDDWMTLFVNSNSLVLAYSFMPNEGILSIELTRGGLSIKDNTWHRAIVVLNKPKETIYLHVDDVESLTTEIKLINSKPLLNNINFLSLSLGGISDNNQYLLFSNLLRNKSPEISKLFSGPDELKFVGCFGEILTNANNFKVNLLQKPDVSSHPKEGLLCRACQEDVVKCPKNYCQNKGRCYNINDNKIACDCKNTQFYGQFCDVKRPSCDPNPCKNGVCQIIENNRICNCTGTGYVGFDCEISHCSNYKCQNNGVCKIKLAMPECDCSKTVYEGQYCETPKCPSDFCQNNGHCLLNNENQLPYCVCKGTGYTGYRCDKPVCPQNYCSKNGNCIVRDDTPVCYCDTGYTGDKCEKPICTNETCLNQGKCTVVDRSPFCICTSDFQGKSCEKPKPCPNGYCFYGGTCKITNGYPRCNCSATGYMGKKCEKPKKCPEKYCENGGKCSIIENNFVCNCSNISYTGERCTNKIGCPDNYCKNNGVCVINSGKFGCDCTLTGYSGDQCDQKADGISCDYRLPGYAITIFQPPIVSSGISTSMGFQTFVKTGILFCYETADDKYWLIKLIDGKLVVDINGLLFYMKTVVNDGKYHVLRVSRDEINFVISLDHFPYENLMIPTAITNILTLPNNIIIYKKLTLCNSCPETSNRNRFQGAIGNARSGKIDITISLKNGVGAMIGGISNILTPVIPLPGIPITQPCTNNYCKNGGKCVVKNYGPMCDCGLSGFGGEKCDQKVMIIKSVPPTPGYVVITRNPAVISNFDLVGFIAQLSESSTPLTTFVTSDGNALEIKIENQQVYIRVNGEAQEPINIKTLEKNVPHFFKMINLLGRITLYVNGTRLGHVVLKEPFLMKNGSIKISKVLVGANRNMDETMKGFLGSFQHNELNLIEPNGSFNALANPVPKVSVEQWKMFGRSMPDIKKAIKTSHGGVVFGSAKFIISEGFGAGDIVSISNSPIVLGAQILGARAIGVNPFILGFILAGLLLVIGIIWAILHLICFRSHVPVSSKAFFVPPINAEFPITPLLHDSASLQLFNGGMQTLVDNNNATLLQGKSFVSSYPVGGVVNNNHYSGFEQASLDMYKAGKDEEVKLIGNSYGKSTFGTGGSIDQERILPVKSTNAYLAPEMNFNQLNVFSEGEMKIDCCVISNNSKFAITGSVSGPPQVWELQNGSLIHIMDGSNQACTSLHLAMNNTMLIGLVTQNQQPLNLKLLMMWSFPDGQVIDFQNELLCTTCCVSNDGKSLILAEESNESSISIINLSNNRKQKFTYNKSDLMNSDGIQFLKQSKNGKFIIAGFRTVDNLTNYMVFDTTKNRNEECGTFNIKANINCNDFINNTEAITGTESGELIIWNLSTVQAVRRILIHQTSSETTGVVFNPHTDSITCVCVSNDGSLLGTAALDSKVRVWSMEKENLLYTLEKHTDEVHSLAFSNDNEILVSGSLDGSIRIWNTTVGQEMCYFSSNLDINKVLISNDKMVVVGLGERAGLNKLVMLKILRNIQQISRSIINDRDNFQLL